MNKSILAVDIGTSSLKAALIDASGNVLADTRCRFPRGPRSPQDWIDAFYEALCALEPGPGLAGLVISGNGPTLVSVGADDRPQSILLWNDAIKRDGDSARGANAVAGAGSVAGERPDSPSIFIPRLNAFRELFPYSYDSSRWIFSGPEFLIWCLTGNAVTILPEIRFGRAYWSPDDLAAAGLDGAKLPPFVLTGTVVGSTRDTGYPELPAGTPVIAGGPDFVVALIGTGTLEAGKACDRAGTSEGLNVCVADRVAHPKIRTLPSVIGNLWNASYLLPETGARFHAFRKQSGQALRSYPEIMAEIEASPILPAAGETLHPGREIVERIAFSVRDGIAFLREATGISPVFCLSGGQARNEIWNRMKADITGATFALTATPDGELMGDAVIGFTAIGEYQSIREAAARMVRVVRAFEPDPKKHSLYSEKYRQHESL